MTLRDQSDDDSEARMLFGANAASFLGHVDAEMADDAQRLGEAVRLIVFHLFRKGVQPAEIGAAAGGAFGGTLADALERLERGG